MSPSTDPPSKQQLRRRFRALRMSLSEGNRARQSSEIVHRVLELPEFRRAVSVACFWPIAGKCEVDVRELDVCARRLGKRVYYPWVDAGAVLACGLRLVDDPASMVPGAFGTREPPVDAPEAASGDVDLVVVPALAVTEAGHRLGYGGGFYDRVLERFAPPATSLVVAFAELVVETLPLEVHDRACDLVVTGTRP